MLILTRMIASGRRGPRALGLVLLVLACTIGAIGQATAAPHFETGDAGESFGTAQDTVGIGSLDVIEGTLADPLDVDLYRIVVEDLSAFSITVTAQLVGPEANNDLTLTVFDDNGIFAYENLDGGDGLLPALALGELSGANLGNPILIGIASFNHAPAQRLSPIQSWFKDPLPAQTGPYQLALTGATFTVVPEPTTAVLLLGGLIALSRRRNGSKPSR